jgi:hypothetical protein
MEKGDLARIFLKNGNEQMGLLLNENEIENEELTGVRLVPSTSIANWLQTGAEKWVQVLDPREVAGIDVFLR